MKRQLITILLYLFIGNAINAQTASKRITTTYTDNSNVFIRYADKSVKQLTFSNSDLSPMLLPRQNAVVFIRNAAGDAKEPKVKKIMKVSCVSLIEKTISDKKPYKDGLEDTNYILGVNSPTLSLDDNYLYFTTEKFATGGELVKVNLTTGVWTELFPADQFELIKKGQYKGLLLIGRSEIKGAGGRRIYYYLVNEKNETLKEFDSEDSFILFKKEMVKS